MKKWYRYLFLCLSAVCSIGVGYSSWISNNSNASISTTVKRDPNLKPVAYIMGKPEKYTTIEKALDVAVSGDIVTVIPGLKDNYHNDLNKVTPDRVTYEITKPCEIKDGVTFILPTDQKTLNAVNPSDANTVNTFLQSMDTDQRMDGKLSLLGTASTYAGYARNSANLYCRTVINVADNVVISNRGRLIISGYLSGGSTGPGMIGQTSHSYAQINLGNNARIEQKSPSASTYCYGFISETTENNNSMLDIISGNFYTPFVVEDFKGFGFSLSMATKKGCIVTDHVSPFNRFELRNATTLVSIRNSAKVYAITNVFINQVFQDTPIIKDFHDVIPIVGTESACVFNFPNNQASMEYKYSISEGKAYVKFYDGLKLNPFKITLTIDKPKVSIDLNTATAYFPVSFRYDVSLLSKNTTSCNFDFSMQMMKLLPGSTFTVGNGCHLSGSEFIVYTAFLDGGNGNGRNSKHELNGYSRCVYPYLPGAICKVLGNGTMNFSKIAGNIYGSSSSVTATTGSTIISKEAWDSKSNPDFSVVSDPRPWTVHEFCEIREKLSVVPLDNLNLEKIYIGFNTFTTCNSYIPAISVDLNDNANHVDVNQYQKVIHASSIKNYRVHLVNNVYNVMRNNVRYEKESLVPYNASMSTITAINSTLDISNNRNGVNEFNVQNITIRNQTPLLNNRVPLFPGSSIQLKADVVDISKSYNRTITWRSLDPSTATVDENGKVTGVKLGQCIIQAECDGVIGEYTANVIEKIEIIPIQKIVILGAINKSRGTRNGRSDTVWGVDGNTEYHCLAARNKDGKFTIEITPSNAPISSIVWKLNASQPGRQYINDSSQIVNIVNDGSTTVTVHFKSGTGISPDYPKLECTVTSLNGEVFKAVFVTKHTEIIL